MPKKIIDVMTPASALTKEQFRKLNKIDDIKALFHLTVRILLNIALILIMFFMASEEFEIGLIAAFLLYATQIHFWGNAGLGHELLHRRVFSSKSVNDGLYQFCSALLWNNAAMFRETHLLHHRETFSDRDSEALSVRNWSLVHVLEYTFIDIRSLTRKIFFVTLNSVGRYPNLTPIEASYARSARATLSINVVLYGTLYLATQELLFVFLMAIAPFSCSLLNKVLAKAQHHGLHSKKENGPLNFSRTLVLPSPLSFLYANMNYHAEHHLAPSVPYYNLPLMHYFLKENGHGSSESLIDFFYGKFQTSWLCR